MEIQRHFIDANGNYFVAPFPSQEQADAYTPPEGALAVTERPSTDHVWQGGTWVYVAPPPPPPPTLAELYAERERRIALPLTVTVPSGATFAINMDEKAQRNIQGLASVGQYFAVADPTHLTTFRDYDNQMQSLTPADLIAMGLQAAARIQACYTAEWALKAMDPIPADFRDDAYWSL